MNADEPPPKRTPRKRKATAKPNPLLDEALASLSKSALKRSLEEATAHAGTPEEGTAAAAALLAAFGKKTRENGSSGLDIPVIRALVRDTEALRMRLDGWSYPIIAHKLGYGHRGNAQRAVQKRLKELRQDCAEDAEALRQTECLRLDAALAAIMPKVRGGDYQAIDRLLRIQDRRAAYEGLDQPKGLKVELTRELDTLLSKLRDAFPDDVFERICTVIAGELGAPSTDGSEGPEGFGSGDGAGGSTQADPSGEDD